MKILIIDDCVDLVGGVERTINTISNELIKENQVEILSENRLVEKSFYNYNEKIKKFYLFNQLDYKSKKYKKYSLKFIYYKILEKLEQKYKKNKLIKQFFHLHKDYDIIIFGRVFICLDFLPVIKKLKIKSKIIVRDAIHLYFFNNSVKRKMLKYFPKMVDTFIVSSDESISVYNKFFKTNNINLIKLYNPLGIKPIEKFDFESKSVVSIGRIDDAQKGFDNLVKAFCFVHKKHPDWVLNLYGGGSASSKLQDLIINLNATSYIKINPPTKNVVELFNKSSIFVLPSRYEGYADILVEALSCGIPSISYNWYMGVEEIIKDQKNGLIVNLKDRKKYFNGCSLDEDCENLGKKICYLIENKEIAIKLSKQAVKIKNNREPNLILNEWINIINNKKEK